MTDEWKRVSLDQFVTFQRGFDLPISDFVKGNIPVFGSTSILGYHNEAKVKFPSVITGRSGTLGKFQYVEVDFFPHNTSLWVKDFKGNNPKFAYYLMQCLDFSGFNSGGAVPTLNRNFLKSFVVDVPPLPIQKKIAAILSAYDDLIENNLKQIRLLEEMAQITYQEWFVRLQFPNHENTPIDETTGLPIGWRYEKLDDIFDFSNGYAFYTVGYSENGYDVIDLGNISTSSDLIISGKEKKISGELYLQSSKFHLNKYDVVIAMTDITKELGILAKSAIIDADNKYVLNQRVGRLRPKNNNIFNYSFIYASLNDKRFILTMQSKSKGSVQFYVNTKDITNYGVLIPKEEIILDFQRVYQPFLETRLNLKKQNQLLKEARNILLPRLMTGKITVGADLSALCE